MRAWAPGKREVASVSIILCVFLTPLSQRGPNMSRGALRLIYGLGIIPLDPKPQFKGRARNTLEMFIWAG